MSESNEHQAMIIPKGAKIIAGDGSDITIDVQGDLILQENQRGLTSLTSRHGSILIDEGVQVHAEAVNSKHMIRIRGDLTIDHLQAEAVMVDGGSLRCGTVESDKIETKDAVLRIKAIKANSVSIRGGSMEVGTINANDLKIKNKVRGSVLIANAAEREIDDSVKLKGGFDSDIELLGYLMKYRNQVLSERVVAKLQEAEAPELKRVLLEQSAEDHAESQPSAAPDAETAPQQEDTEVFEVEAVEPAQETESLDTGEDQEDVQDPYETEDAGKPDFNKMQEWAETLEAQIKAENNSSAVLKLITTGLRQGDTDTLQTIFTRWRNNVEEEKKNMPEAMKSVLEEVELAMSS